MKSTAMYEKMYEECDTQEHVLSFLARTITFVFFVLILILYTFRIFGPFIEVAVLNILHFLLKHIEAQDIYCFSSV